MSNEQFTDALAAKSAQLHVGLDNSTRATGAQNNNNE